MAKFNREMEKLLNKAKSPRIMRVLAKKSVEIIVSRTQNGGFGVDTNGGRTKKLRDVSPDYAKWRDKKRGGEKTAIRKLKAKGKTRKRIQYSPKGATGRSCNLTLTGRMLRTLKPIKVDKGSAEIGWSIERERKKAGYAVDTERDFLNLSTNEIKLLSKELDKNLSKEAKKI
jgi:hypothetical protein